MVRDCKRGKVALLEGAGEGISSDHTSNVKISICSFLHIAESQFVNDYGEDECIAFFAGGSLSLFAVLN